MNSPTVDEPTAPAAAPTPWLTAREAAARAKVGIKVIYRAVRRHQLKTVKVSNALRFHPTWVDAWLEAHATVVVINPEAPGPAIAWPRS